ncbi:MAG: MmcQ/YjbR family DNA-binding protein [Ferruginibacter sp.]
MVSIENFRKMALLLPEATESLHFDKPSFRIKNKIFATLHLSNKIAMLKLSLVQQSVFSDIDRTIIYPVPGGWGRQGATFVELAKVKKEILKEALVCAWRNTASKTLLKNNLRITN